MAVALTAEPDQQDGMFDQVIENDVLEAALERRAKKKAAASIAGKEAKEADAAAKGQIAALELEPDTIVRCGRFRIKHSSVAERHVEFDTDATSRLTISLLKG